jgi:hypothetical protein
MIYALFGEQETFKKPKKNYSDFVISSREDFNLLIPDYFSDKNKFNHLRVKAIYNEEFFKHFEFYMNGLKINTEIHQSEIEMEFENQKHVLKISSEPTNLTVLSFRFEYFVYRIEEIYAMNEFFVAVYARYQGPNTSKAVNEIVNIILENDLEGTLLTSEFIDILGNNDLNSLLLKLVDKRYSKRDLKLLCQKYGSQIDYENQIKITKYLMPSSNDDLYN